MLETGHFDKGIGFFIKLDNLDLFGVKLKSTMFSLKFFTVDGDAIEPTATLNFVSFLVENPRANKGFLESKL